MNRLVINENNLNLISASDCVLLDLKNISRGILNISKDVHIYISEPTSNKKLVLNLYKGCNVSLSILAKENLDKLNLEINVFEGSIFNSFFADFSNGKEKVKVDINLNDEFTNAYWHLASLSSKTDDKEFDVSIYHNAKNTNGLSDNYGVCKDNARLIFSGVSKIVNGATKSKTRQNAKIMEFDRYSKAIAKPILKIDEHDIEASHGAVVGKINDDHLFYLTSRGLSDSDAKRLITFGYLKPIIVGFLEDEVKEEINNLIEERM